MNPRVCTLLPLAALVLFAGGASAAPLTYQLNDWGDHSPQTHIGGSIRIDDADGNRVINASEVLDWSFSGAVIPFNAPPGGPIDPLPFAMFMGPGSLLDCPTTGCFMLDGADLVLDIRTQGPTAFRDAAGTRFDIAGDSGLGGDAVRGDRIASMRWFNAGGLGATSMSMAFSTTLRIASAQPIAEPSSAALLALALAAAAGATRARRQTLALPPGVPGPGAQMGAVLAS